MASHSARSVSAVPMVRVTRTSTVDLIVAELRNAIYNGALPVGSAIGEVEMASQLGVSRSPLRESTQRLVQEGLLTATPGRGLRVSIIDADHVADVYRARTAIETQAARIVARRAEPTVIAQIEAALAVLTAASEDTDARTIGDADLAFHQTLVDAAGSRRLSHYMRTLAIETRIASFSAADGYSVRRSVSSTYRELLDALRAGDDIAAAAALERQFVEAVERLTGHSDEIETVETPADEHPPTLGPLDLSET